VSAYRRIGVGEHGNAAEDERSLTRLSLLEAEIGYFPQEIDRRAA
jgi:hypothetical protein